MAIATVDRATDGDERSRHRRILVVEDVDAERRTTTFILERSGYVVEVAGGVREALQMASSVDVDVALVDLGLPDGDGVELCRRLARWPAAPVVVLSGDDREERMIAALDAGAADYVTKPYSAPLLLARLRAVVRRLAEGVGASDERFVVGDVMLDRRAHRAWIAGQEVDLHHRLFETLATMMRNEGALLTHGTLLGRRSGEHLDPRELNALRITVSRLRKLLGQGPLRPIVVTVAGVGYRLVAADGEVR